MNKFLVVVLLGFFSLSSVMVEAGPGKPPGKTGKARTRESAKKTELQKQEMERAKSKKIERLKAFNELRSNLPRTEREATRRILVDLRLRPRELVQKKISAYIEIILKAEQAAGLEGFIKPTVLENMIKEFSSTPARLEKLQDFLRDVAINITRGNMTVKDAYTEAFIKNGISKEAFERWCKGA